MKTKYKILFPSEPYNIKNIDSEFAGEWGISRLFFDYHFFDFDSFVNDKKFITTINFDDECVLIYRGWMLKPEQYKEFYNYILYKSNKKIKLINSTEEYENCHCFPNVYELIENYTPKMVILGTPIDLTLKHIEFDFFLKDFVKSAKTEKGVEKISKNINPDEFMVKMNEFIKERDHLFTGGIILKEFVSLKQFNGKTNEWRVFYFKDKILSVHQNSYLDTKISPPIFLVKKVGEKLENKSNFFTVDFALTENNEWVIIETGDGQVSGLCKGQELKFYNRLKKLEQLK
jgi:hypothetical protein